MLIGRIFDGSWCLFFFFNPRLRTCLLILERVGEEGRERERETEKHWSVSSCMHPNQDWTSNPAMCPDQELSLWPFGLPDDAQLTEPPGQGGRWCSKSINKAFWLTLSQAVHFERVFQDLRLEGSQCRIIGLLWPDVKSYLWESSWWLLLAGSNHVVWTPNMRGFLVPPSLNPRYKRVHGLIWLAPRI